jgi:sec-independent protein translocase protein TatC
VNESVWDILRRLWQQVWDRVKWRVVWTGFAFGVGTFATWWYREAVFDLLLVPSGGNLSPFDGKPVYTELTGMMGASIRLALMGGRFAAVPVATIGIITLFQPLLPRQLRRFITIFLPATALLFAAGVAFAFFVMLPAGLNFLLHFGDGTAVPLITITSYMGLLTGIMFSMGVVFELPLAMFLLAKMRIVSHRQLANLKVQFLFMPVAAFTLGAILTPGMDPVNAIFIAVPFIVLYEVGLFLAWLARPQTGGDG